MTNAFDTRGPAQTVNKHQQAMARRLLQNPLKVQRINSFNSAIPTSADKDKTMRIGGKL